MGIPELSRPVANITKRDRDIILGEINVLRQKYEERKHHFQMQSRLDLLNELEERLKQVLPITRRLTTEQSFEKALKENDIDIDSVVEKLKEDEE